MDSFDQTKTNKLRKDEEKQTKNEWRNALKSINALKSRMKSRN